jgi:hypothetical protein
MIARKRGVTEGNEIGEEKWRGRVQISPEYAA